MKCGTSYCGDGLHVTLTKCDTRHLNSILIRKSGTKNKQVCRRAWRPALSGWERRRKRFFTLKSSVLVATGAVPPMTAELQSKRAARRRGAGRWMTCWPGCPAYTLSSGETGRSLPGRLLLRAHSQPVGAEVGGPNWPFSGDGG